MNKAWIIFILCIAIGKAGAQSPIPVTGIPDTSYTYYSAYQSTVKTFPYIKMVEEFHSDSVAEQKDILYCKMADRELKLDVFYPRQKDKTLRTAVLFIYGGGWRSGNRTQHYPLAQRLAKLGFVCITPEYRLSTEALYPAAVHDLKSAMRWIRANASKYNIDVNKIVVAGFSAGGELAAFIGATNGKIEFEDAACNPGFSSVANAVIDIDGILSFVHPESGEGVDSKRLSAATQWFGYPKKDNPALWEQGSALTHAGKSAPPILFLNSSVDRMHAGRDDYIKILDKYHIYSEIKKFEGAPHLFCLFDPWFEPALKYMDDFLKTVFNK